MSIKSNFNLLQFINGAAAETILGESASFVAYFPNSPVPTRRLAVFLGRRGPVFYDESGMSEEAAMLVMKPVVKKYRPWTPNEIPELNIWIRQRGTVGSWFVTGVDTDRGQIFFANRWYKLSDIAECYEYSTGNRKGPWHPCCILLVE